MKLVLTNHIVDRYLERFDPKEKNKVQAAIKVTKLIREGVEDRSRLNDFNFMERFYERHGFDSDFKVVVNGNFVAIIVVENSKMVGITCIIDHRLGNRNKFAGKKKVDKKGSYDTVVNNGNVKAAREVEAAQHYMEEYI